MRTCFTWIVLFLFLLLATLLPGQENHANWNWTVTPIELDGTGRMPRKGMFVGHHNGVDILAGGVRTDTFGNQQFFQDIYIHDKKSTHWIKQAIRLPSPELGLSLSTKDGIYCIGSQNSQIVLLAWNPETQQLSQKIIDGWDWEKPFNQLVYFEKKIYLLNQHYFADSLKYPVFDLESKSYLEKDRIPYAAKATLWGTLQGNGLHNCAYHFDSRDQSVGFSNFWEYNLFLNEWESVPVPFKKSNIDQHVISLAIGAAHNLFIGVGKNANELWSHYTISNSWHKIDTLPALPFSFGALIQTNKNNIRIPAIDFNGNFALLQAIIPSQQQTFGTLNYIILFLYFLVLLLMGVYFSRRQKSTEDYFKGGGRIPWWAAGISIFGTALSAISFMAIPAKTFATDWSYLFNNLGPLYVAPIIALFFVPFFIRLDLSTAYEYLEKRFNLATRLLGSLSFIIYQIGRIGIVLYLPAIALNVVTGLDIIFCIALMGILSVIYTMMGGIEGVIWTDVLQVIILMGGGFLCLVILILNTDGGLDVWWQTAVTDNKFNIIDMRIDWQHPTFIVVLLGGFFSNLVSYSTDQTFVQRYLTASDVGKAKKSVYTNAILMFPATLLFFSIGTALYVFYQQNPSELQPGLSATDAIFPYFILSQLPQGVSGLLIAGVFAAAMSTLSSSMNSVASAYSNDFHARFGWSGSPLSVARWSTLVTGIIGTVFAMLMATSDIKSVWDEFLKIIGLITGGLGGIFVLGMVSKRANGTGALIGLLGSAVIQYWLGVTKPVHLLLFTATGFTAAVGIGYLASLIFPEDSPPKKI